MSSRFKGRPARPMAKSVLEALQVCPTLSASVSGCSKTPPTMSAGIPRVVKCVQDLGGQGLLSASCFPKCVRRPSRIVRPPIPPRMFRNACQAVSNGCRGTLSAPTGRRVLHASGQTVQIWKFNGNSGFPPQVCSVWPETCGSPPPSARREPGGRNAASSGPKQHVAWGVRHVRVFSDIISAGCCATNQLQNTHEKGPTTLYPARKHGNPRNTLSGSLRSNENAKNWTPAERHRNKITGR